MLEYLKDKDYPHAHYYAVDSDIQSLERSTVENKIMVGHSVTRGLSTGGDPDLGKKIFENYREIFQSLAQDADLIFLCTGLGGGFGTAVAPLFADLAKKEKNLMFVFATLPFNLEGGTRNQRAEAGLMKLRSSAQATISLPNDLLLQSVDESHTILTAFARAHEWIDRGIQSIFFVMYQPGIINLDYQSLFKLFENSGGKTLYALGRGEGVGYIQSALESIEVCPLLHTPQASQAADSLLINIIGGTDLSLKDVNQLCSILALQFKSKDNTLIGAVIDENKKEFIDITVIGVSNFARTTRRKKNGLKSEYSESKQQDLFAEFTSVQFGQNPEPNFSLETRGYFSETDKTIFNGEDLDIPTYLRKAIRLKH